jgi:hypothetical protein
MKRPSLNFLVDGLAFTAFVLLTTSGVLMRYVLPPGSGHFTMVWGLDRHEWGSLHFWLAIVLLAALTLHVYLHWRWIVTVVRGRPREGSGARIGLGIVGLLALLALALAPFVSPVERTGTNLRPRGPHSEEMESRGAIRGFMTLREVEQATGVPADSIARALGLPADLSPGQRLGRLGRTYGFTMQDVRRIVEEHQQSR